MTNKKDLDLHLTCVSTYLVIFINTNIFNLICTVAAMGITMTIKAESTRAVARSTDQVMRFFIITNATFTTAWSTVCSVVIKFGYTTGAIIKQAETTSICCGWAWRARVNALAAWTLKKIINVDDTVTNSMYQYFDFCNHSVHLPHLNYPVLKYHYSYWY